MDERDLRVGFYKNISVTTDDGGNTVGLKSLERYFDNLAAATTNKKTVIEQLFTSNAKLAATNEELVAVDKKVTNNSKDLQQECNRLKKRGGRRATQGKRNPTLCHHCKKEGYHDPSACFDIVNNKHNCPPGRKNGL